MIDAILAGFVLTQTPSGFARRAPLALKVAAPGGDVAIAGMPHEVRVDFAGTWDNPFDPADARLDATITAPDGTVKVVPGFWAQDFTRELRDGKETLTPGGVSWRVRFYPATAGTYSVRLVAKDRSGTAEATTRIDIAASSQPVRGFIRRSPRDGRYFEFDDGSPYFPIGANVCWAGVRGTYDYDDSLPNYAKNGANYTRLWLSPEWTTFAHEKKNPGLGFIAQDGAWRTDYVLNLAQRHGIAVMLTFDSYNILRDRDAHNFWEQTPHNADHGGPLRIWSQFWTNERMDRIYRNRLRYLVARYSALPSVKSWEFWNEVDLTRDFDPVEVRAWHQRMARELRRIDPYRRLITTSFSSTPGVKEIDTLPEIDYVQTHHYGNDPVAALLNAHYRKFQYGKPHVVSEIGADWQGPNNDPTGIQIHDPMWAAIAAGSAGGAMAWWWDSLIAPKDLYKLFLGPSRFVAGVDFPAEKFQPANLRLRVQNPSALPQRRDWLHLSGPIGWDPSPVNQPKTVTLRPNATSGLPLAGVLHGRRNHLRLHNPVTFRISTPQPATFEILVGDVSGYGGAGLTVDLNGRRVVTRDFPDPDDNTKTETLKQFAQVIPVRLPKGEHTLVVTNPGRDWVNVGYRMRNFLTTPEVPVSIWGVVGETTVLAWLRESRRSWQFAITDPNPRLLPATVVRVPGLAAGTWRAEVWDTIDGTIRANTPVRVGPDGFAEVRIPSFRRDVALRLRKQ